MIEEKADVKELMQNNENSIRENKIKSNEAIPDEIKTKVENQIAEECGGRKKMGLCYWIWGRKKELYRNYGYIWYSPQELNPHIYYD